MADGVIAEGLAVAIVAILFFSLCHTAMRHRPAEIGMGWGSPTDNDRGLDEQVIPPPDDWYRVAKVALRADGFSAALTVNDHMFFVVATEAAQSRIVALIVGIGIPGQIHVREVGTRIQALDL